MLNLYSRLESGADARARSIKVSKRHRFYRSKKRRLCDSIVLTNSVRVEESLMCQPAEIWRPLNFIFRVLRTAQELWRQVAGLVLAALNSLAPVADVV
jgi:hypothetical protein